MEQSTQAVWRAVKFVLFELPQLVLGHFRGHGRANVIERPHLQFEVSELSDFAPVLVVAET